MVTHDDIRADLFIVVVRITLFTVHFKSTSLMMRANTEGNCGNLRGADVTCHLIYISSKANVLLSDRCVKMLISSFSLQVLHLIYLTLDMKDTALTFI